jgi:hypothetical protein
VKQKPGFGRGAWYWRLRNGECGRERSVGKEEGREVEGNKYMPMIGREGL